MDGQSQEIDAQKSRHPLMDHDEKPVVVLGARSLVAPYVLRRLAEKGRTCEIVSRHEVPFPPSLANYYEPVITDLAQKSWKPKPKSTIISLLPLWVMAEHIELFEQADVLIAVGSTSVFAKTDSPDPKERELAQKLAEAEELLRQYCQDHDILLTILRPTLIYDGKNDKNITQILNMAKKTRFFPVAGPANGLRQPIHADDVADAIMGALDSEDAVNRDFNIAGGEVLTYREMVKKVYEAHGVKPSILSLPTALLENSFKAAKKLRLIRNKSAGYAMFQRMNEDLVFDIDDGLQVLNYNPRKFTPKPEDELEPKPQRRLKPTIDDLSPYPTD